MITIPLTREQLEAKRQALAAEGVTATGDSGTISQHGCSIQFDYRDGNLNLTVLHKPFFIGMGVVEHDLREFFTP